MERYFQMRIIRLVDGMRFNYFALVVVLITLFSLCAVSASENATDAASVEEDVLASQDVVTDLENQDKISSGEDVDLSVSMDVEQSCEDGEYNKVGSEVSWKITVNAKGGTAHNTKVRGVFSPNLGYVSHNGTMGSYNPSTGIWDIGDLDRSKTASLTILTKLKVIGTYTTKVYALTDSNDRDMLNNFMFLSIYTGSSKVKSNITDTTDDDLESDHDLHYASMIQNRIEGDDDFDDDDDPDTPKSPENPKKRTHAKTKNPLVKESSGFLDDARTIVQNVFNPTSNGSSGSKGISQSGFSDAIPPYDFTTIPVLIFSAFMLILLAIFARDRIKSKN